MVRKNGRKCEREREPNFKGGGERERERVGSNVTKRKNKRKEKRMRKIRGKRKINDKRNEYGHLIGFNGF